MTVTVGADTSEPSCGCSKPAVNHRAAQGGDELRKLLDDFDGEVGMACLIRGLSFPLALFG